MDQLAQGDAPVWHDHVVPVVIVADNQGEDQGGWDEGVVFNNPQDVAQTRGLSSGILHAVIHRQV